MRHVSKFQWLNMFFQTFTYTILRHFWMCPHYVPPFTKDVSSCQNLTANASAQVERARALGKRVQVLAISKWPATNQARFSTKQNRGDTKLRHTSFFLKTAKDMGVSLNGGTPISHPKSWSFSVGQPMGLLGKPTILGTPPPYRKLLGIFSLGSSKVPSSKQFGFIGFRDPIFAILKSNMLIFFLKMNHGSLKQESTKVRTIS